MDLLGSIMGSMDKPPTASERERKMQKALQAKTERRLEAEQKQRAKFRTEAEHKLKQFMSNDDQRELPFTSVSKVYRAILHDVAEAAGLFSHSVGEGDEKDLVITKEPCTQELSHKKPQTPTQNDPSLTPASEATPTVTPTSSNYQQKYQHLIGGLECAEKTAVKMEPNKAFGYVPSANKRDHRSIEQTMNELRTKKKPRLDPSPSPSLSSPSVGEKLSLTHSHTQCDTQTEDTTNPSQKT